MDGSQIRTAGGARRTIRHVALAMAAAAGLGGCMVGPDYKPPQVKVQPSFTEAGSPGAPTTQPSVTTSRAVEITQWWATFQDPELESLVDRAVKGNFNLHQAESRIRQARFQEGVAGASTLR